MACLLSNFLTGNRFQFSKTTVEEPHMKKQVLSFAAVGFLLITAQSGFAGMLSPAGTLNYQLDLTGSCTVLTVTDALGTPNLGTYDTGAGDKTGLPAGDVSVTCSAGFTSYAVCLNGGASFAGTSRHLSAGTTTDLAYRLRLSTDTAGIDRGDLGCTTMAMPGVYSQTAAWASPLPGTVGPDFTLVADVDIPVTSEVGSYTDTVDVTVVW